MPAKDQHAYNVAYYAAHRAQEYGRVRERQTATLEWLRSIRCVPCTDCHGTFAPYVMQFDHRDPSAKSFQITSGNALLSTRARLLAEIAKCDIVCANCHRIRTAAAYKNGTLTRRIGFTRAPATSKLVRYRREHARRLRAAQLAVLDRIRQLPCADCHRCYPTVVMEFDHREPRPKKRMLAVMAGRVRIATLLAEIAKCDIVCANCHAERTYHRRLCADVSCMRVWCSGHACDPSKIEGRVRFSSPAPSAKPPRISELATQYVTAA